MNPFSTVFQTNIAGFDIILKTDGHAFFEVHYGEEIHRGMYYDEAECVLGRAIFHALVCEGKLG